MIKLEVKHSEPFVKLDEVKENLRVLVNDEDRLIERLTATACQYVQELSGRQLNSDTFSYSFSEISTDAVYLPTYPIQSVESFTYFDVDNIEQVIDVNTLRIFSDTENGYILPADGEVWPSLYDRPDAVKITYIAGYPADQLFPENLKQAAILLASHWFENRTATGQRLEDIPHGVECLINISKAHWYV